MSRNVSVIAALVVIILAIGLFRAKDGARTSLEEKAALEQELVIIKKDIRLLEIEYDTLSNWERIAQLAQDQLGMAPVRADQIIAEPGALRPMIDEQSRPEVSE